jgi:hypothetical protein
MKFGIMTPTSLWALTFKFNEYMMDLKHSMIRELRVTINNITNEQQVQVVIRSLLESS